MIPLIRSEIVDRFGWLTQKQFIDLIAISEMTPGPLALNSASLVGFRVAGLSGAIVATVAVVIPSYMVMVIVQSAQSKIKGTILTGAIFRGIKASVVGLIVVAVLSLGKIAIVDWETALMTFALIVILVRFKTHPVVVLTAAGLVGLLIFR